MDKKTVFVKTGRGDSEVNGQSDELFGDVKRILHLVDDESTVGEITKRAPPSLRDTLQSMLQELVDGGFIKDIKAPAAEPAKPALKMATPAFKMASPRFAAPQAPIPPVAPVKAAPQPRPVVAGEPSINSKSDLDFSFIMSATDVTASAADKQKAEAEAIAKKNQMEEAAKAAKRKAYDEAKLRAQIEVAARAKIEAEAKLKMEAEAARLKAEQEALKARSESELAKARAEAEARARIEAEIRIKQEAEAARLRAEREAEKLRLELEAAKAKAELEVKIRYEAEMRARVEAEARARREAEAERLKLEKQRAELEVARIKAEAELKLREEAELRLRAELEAREKAEALARKAALGNAGEMDPADRLRQSFAESSRQAQASQSPASPDFKLDNFSLLDTGKMPAYAAQPVKPDVLPGAGSKVKAAIAQRAQKEAEAQLLKAAQEAAQLKAEQDEAARIKFEQEHAARIKVEQELMRLKAEQDAQDKAEAEARMLAEQQAKQWEEGQKRAAVQAQAEIESMAREAAEAKAKSKVKPSRGPRKPLPIGKIMAGVFILLVATVFALPYVLPLDDYIAPLEKEISGQIHQPVHIKKIDFTLVPLKLQLHSFSMGNAEELKVANVELNFDFSALFAPVKSISKLELENLLLAPATFEKAMPWLESIGKSEKYPVARMELKNARINSDQLKLPALNGKIEFGAQGLFTHADLQTEDGKLAIELQPQQNRFQLELNLHDSSLPILSATKFTDLNINAVLDNGQFTISDFFAHIHGGTLTGKGLLSWMNGWKLQGQINAKSLDMQRMFPNFGVSGEIAGDMLVSMNSLKLAQLDNDPHFEGMFEAKNGVIHKLDIETGVRFGVRPGVAGHTNFAEMSGTVKADALNQRFIINKLVLPSSLVTGFFDVDAKQQLSGKFMVDIKGQGDVPFQLSGSATDPAMQVGR